MTLLVRDRVCEPRAACSGGSRRPCLRASFALGLLGGCGGAAGAVAALVSVSGPVPEVVLV